MCVRVDREGATLSDFHTAGGGLFLGQEYTVHGTNDPVITRRDYLTDASFLAAIGFEDEGLAVEIDAALAAPRWPLFLGRRSCPPSLPIRAGLVGGEPEAALRRAPWPGLEAPSEPVRVVVECGPDEGEPRSDQPLSFRAHARHYARRFVRTEWIEPAGLELASPELAGLSLVGSRRSGPKKEG